LYLTSVMFMSSYATAGKLQTRVLLQDRLAPPGAQAHADAPPLHAHPPAASPLQTQKTNGAAIAACRRCVRLTYTSLCYSTLLCCGNCLWQISKLYKLTADHVYRGAVAVDAECSFE